MWVEQIHIETIRWVIQENKENADLTSSRKMDVRVY